MNELQEKKKFLQNALRLCEIEIVQNLIGKKISCGPWSGCVVVSVEVNTEYPNYSYMTFRTSQGSRVKEFYKNVSIENEE